MQILAARLAHGDDSAFAELYDACADRLFRFAACRLGRDGAADVVQTAFLRAVRSRRRFRRVDDPVAYMFQIVRNETIRTAAVARRKPSQLAVPPNEPLIDDDAHDEKEMIAVALERLNNDDREIVELKVFGGLTFEEVSAVVGRPANTTATRYRRALESLRPWLAKQISRES